VADLEDMAVRDKLQEFGNEKINLSCSLSINCSLFQQCFHPAPRHTTFFTYLFFIYLFYLSPTTLQHFHSFYSYICKVWSRVLAVINFILFITVSPL